MSDYSPDATYTLDDLANWDFPGTSLAVLGYPVRHSISPQMHNAALASMATADPKFSNWRYFRFEVPPEKLAEALPIFHEKGFFGLNLTVPHKTMALELIEQIDPAAQQIGAVNTLLRLETGYAGHNTDGYGMENGILEDLSQNIAGQDIVLLGAGGAGRAAAFQCLYSDCKSLTLFNRNQDRLNALASELNPVAEEKGIPLEARSTEEAEISISSNALIINSASLGLKAEDPLILPPSSFSPNAKLFDMIYNPPQTKLMQTLAASGGQVANGLSMLIHQGAKALEIWSETKVPSHLMKKAALEAMG